MPLVNTALTLKDLPPAPEGKTGWPWTEQSEPLPDKMADGSDWPRISIVTPSYNQGQFIEETIRSVLLQGYPNLEYIIIDGGSNDNSVEIIKKYEKFLAYWVSESDEGQSSAINKGFKISTGIIMAWMNSDDFFCKSAFYNVAKKYKFNLQWWTGEAIQIFANNNLKEVKYQAAKYISKKELLHTRKIIYQVATFWTRNLWDKVGGSVNTELNLSMDYELWLRFSNICSAIVIPNVLGYFRTHDNAKTGSDKGYELYLKQCDIVRLKEYQKQNINRYKRIILINFWSRYFLFKQDGSFQKWKYWLGNRNLPYV